MSVCTSTTTTKFGVSVGDDAPDVDSLPIGTLWFNRVTGRLNVLYEDVDSRQCVETLPYPTPNIQPVISPP